MKCAYLKGDNLSI